VSDFESLLLAREPLLFSRLGQSDSLVGTRCLAVTQVAELLQEQHLEYAMLEAANECNWWRIQQDSRRVAEERSALTQEVEACLLRVGGRTELLRRSGLDDKSRQIVVRYTTSIITLALVERRWNMPVDDRIFGPLDAVIAQGHIVCGWVDGLYPEGQWAVW
jgi:hypothetical protein